MTEPSLILIVDDDDNNLELQSRLVELAGHRVVRADCGSAAITAIATQKPDLVLLDWMMPDLSGIDVLRSIRQDYDENALPVIMCTALSEAEYVSAALKEGANDFLSKPLNSDVMAARINSQLLRKSAMATLDAFNRQLESTVAERTRKLLQITSRPFDFANVTTPDLACLFHIVRAVADADIRKLSDLQEPAQHLLKVISRSPVHTEDGSYAN